MLHKIWIRLKETGALATAIWAIKSTFYYPVIKRIDNRFDRKYGTDTSLRLAPNAFDGDPKIIIHAVEYSPTPDILFLQLLKMHAVKIPTQTFIDLGCGKGRTLMLAARLPFKAIIGVEFEPNLHSVCQKNLQTYTQICNKVRCMPTVVCQDAGNFTFPEGNLLLYLFNPFNGQIMEKMVDRLTEAINASPRHVQIIYLHPNQLEHLMRLPRISIVHDKLYRDRKSANNISRVTVLESLPH